jgi:hypothetical protein
MTIHKNRFWSIFWKKIGLSELFCLIDLKNRIFISFTEKFVFTK